MNTKIPKSRFFDSVYYEIKIKGQRGGSHEETMV